MSVEPSPEGEGGALLLGAGHALVDAHVVVEGFGGVTFGRVAPFQAHSDVDGFGVLQADIDDALAGLPGPTASLGVEEGDADENDAFRNEAVEEEGGAGDTSAEGCDGRDLDYRVEVLADGCLYAGDLICGEGVEQLLADGLWVDDQGPSGSPWVCVLAMAGAVVGSGAWPRGWALGLAAGVGAGVAVAAGVGAGVAATVAGVGVGVGSSPPQAATRARRAIMTKAAASARHPGVRLGRRVSAHCGFSL